jgi:hypothetical protein
MKLAAIVFASFFSGMLIGITTNGHLFPQSVFTQRVASAGPFSLPKVPSIDSAVPKVPPLLHTYIDHSVFAGVPGVPERYALDGLETDNVRFDNPSGGITFEYGGGAYRLSNVIISGQLNLELTGAAANTATLLDSLGLLKNPLTSLGVDKVGMFTTIPKAPTQATEIPKNKPIINKLKLANPLKGDISSQYDGGK